MNDSALPQPPGLAGVAALGRLPVVARVAAAARARGTPAHLVGGMVRDAWLGRPTKDVDVVVGGQGLEVAEELAAALPARLVHLGGKEFAAFRLVGGGFVVDIWDREGVSLEADLERRDFTVNALALDLAATEGQGLVDLHGGLRDLERRRLRAVTAAGFSADPLRVLRLARLVAELPGFAAEAATRELARQAVPGLPGVAAERVRDELERLFSAPGAARGLAELAALDLYPGLLLGRPGEPPPWAPGAADGAATRAVAEIEALAWALGRLADMAAELLPGAALEVDLPAARLALAMSHLPGDKPAAALRGLTRRGFLTRRAAAPASLLVECPEAPPPGEAGERERRLLLHRLGRSWPTALALWGARATGGEGADAWEGSVRELLALLRGAGEEILDPPRLLTGDEVRELLGLAPGPEVGQALEALRRAQVEGRVRTREEAVAAVLSGRSRTCGPRSPSGAG